MRKSRTVIRKLVNKVLKDCNITCPPINLAQIVSAFDITVEKISLPNKEAFNAAIDVEDKIILFNSTHPYLRRRFSIAHELGHFFLSHKDVQEFDLYSKNPNEIEANIFAAELLLPFKWLQGDLKNNSSVGDLSEKYKVSKEAIGWRLASSDSLLR